MAAGEDATGLALLPVDPDGGVRRFDEQLGVPVKRDLTGPFSAGFRALDGRM